MRQTDRVTTQFTQLLINGGQRRAARLVAGFDHYANQIEEATNDGESQGPAKWGGIAHGLLKAMDDTISDQLARDDSAERIACRAGCAHCCHLEVRITQGEAVLLLYGVGQLGEGADPDAARLKAQADAKEWTDLPPDMRRCAFLGDDNKCKVYDYRPGACRKYFALDNSDDCDTIKENGKRVINIVMVEAEVIASAMISRTPNGRFANMLIEELRRE